MPTKWLNYLGWNLRASANNAQTYQSPQDTIVKKEIIFHNDVRYSVVQRRTTEGKDYVEVETVRKHGKNRVDVHSVNGLEEFVKSTGFTGEIR